MKETIMSKISDEQFTEFVKTASSIKEVVYQCGYSCNSGASNALIKRRIEELKLSTAHFLSTPKISRTDEEIFVEDSPVDQATLRRRFLKLNIVPYICSICGQEPVWQGKELVLTLDHINGHNKDDRIENLRWVCPNCDRQLETFAGRNIAKENKKNFCIDCGAEIAIASTRCPKCANKQKGLRARRVDRPTRDELKAMIRTMPFTKIGEKFGITDNAIRKWCDEYGLPRTKKAIITIKDIDWELL